MASKRRPSLHVRRPPKAASQETIDQLVATGSAILPDTKAPTHPSTQTPMHSDTQVSEIPEPKGVIARKDGRKQRRFNAHFDLELFRRLRRFAFDTEEDMSKVVSAALEAYLNEKGY